MRSGYLLDTNHLGLAVRLDSPVRRQVIDRRMKGAKIGTIVPALCELQVGARSVSNPDEYQFQLKRLMEQIRVWPLDIEASHAYGDLYRELKAKGRVLSQVDMMIAAFARQNRLVVVTTDRDFDAIPDVPTENWAST